MCDIKHINIPEKIIAKQHRIKTKHNCKTKNTTTYVIYGKTGTQQQNKQNNSKTAKLKIPLHM